MAADGGGGGAAGGNAGSGGGNAGTGGGGFFITGTADGVVRRDESDLRAGTEGLIDPGMVWMAGTETSASWTIYVQNHVTTHDCGQAFMMLSDDQGSVSDQAGGSCSVTITSAAPNVGDVVAGTFSATLKSAGSAPRTVTVTDGAFRVVRTDP